MVDRPCGHHPGWDSVRQRLERPLEEPLHIFNRLIQERRLILVKQQSNLFLRRTVELVTIRNQYRLCMLLQPEVRDRSSSDQVQ